MKNQTKTILNRWSSSRHWRNKSSSRKVPKSKLSNLRFLLFWFLFQYPFLKTNFHHFFSSNPARNLTPTSIDDLQVSALKDTTRTSYVLHKFFHQSYLILEFKWSLMLILDSCRFELIKIKFLYWKLMKHLCDTLKN